LRIEQDNDVVTAYGTAARAIEIADILTETAFSTLLVCEVGHTLYRGDNLWPVELTTLVAEAGITGTIREIDWASSVVGQKSELLLMDRTGLVRLLTPLPLYDISIVDAAHLPSEERQDQMVLTAITHRRDEPPALNSLPESGLYFQGHDDCYFYVECRDRELPMRLMARLVTNLAGSALLGDREEVAIQPPPRTLVSKFFEQSKEWTIWPIGQTEDGLTLGLRPEHWQPPQRLLSPLHTLTYTSATGRWEGRE
jgi:hypothetical protein